MQCLLMLGFSVMVSTGCSETPQGYVPVVIPEKIGASMMNWLYYNRDQMKWSADFLALDTSAQVMDRGDFLYRLTTGQYLPVRMKTGDAGLCYRLYKVKEGIDKDITATIKSRAEIAFRYYQLEGQRLPSFEFKDLAGHVYNASNMKGKIVVLNCWYIHCKACVEEMPELNKIVEQAKGREDVVFLGLAFDQPDALKEFLSKRRFDYSVVADKENYLMNVLGIVACPTHVIVNRQGKIVKIIDGGINEFIEALNGEISKRGIAASRRKRRLNWERRVLAAKIESGRVGTSGTVAGVSVINSGRWMEAK